MTTQPTVRAAEIEDEQEFIAQYDPPTLRVYQALKDVARRKDWIGYEQLNQACSLGLDLTESRDRNVIGGYAGAVSRFEVSKHRSMLSAVLVHVKSPREPGPGFYELARELARYKQNDTDRQVWIRELNDSHAYWNERP